MATPSNESQPPSTPSTPPGGALPEVGTPAAGEGTPAPSHRRRAWSKKQGIAVGVGVLAVAAVVTAVSVGLSRGGGDSAEAAAPSASSAASSLDTSVEQAGRVRYSEVPEAVAALKASGFTPVNAGELTVASTGGSIPITFYADDSKTLVGSDIDVAQLVADGLGLKLNVVVTSWADWPLGVQSGKYDVVLSNVGVTEERKDLFDFATYRHGLHTFLVPADSPVTAINEAKDIAGLKIVVGSGTN